MKIFTLSIFFFVCLFLTSCGKPGKENFNNNGQQKPEFVTIKEIKYQEFKHFIEIQGMIESDNFVMVSPQVSGNVKKIYVGEGDRVKAGQLLVELDGGIIEASLDAMEKNLELQTEIYKRRTRLREKKIGSEIEYLEAKSSKENLEKQVLSLREQLQQSRILSPIDGTIDDILVKRGESATVGVGAVRILNLSGLKITAELSERYITQVKKGNEVHIQIPIIDKTYILKIDTVSQFIDADNRTFKIEINIPAKEKDLKPNMMAILNINDYTKSRALLVPQKIVQKINGEKFLFIAVKSNELWLAKKRMVKTGKSYKNKVDIIEGLSQMEKVITAGAEKLTDGQLISFNKANSGSVNREGD
jgi:membrane fusion protein (multidrug efflux system)